MKSFSSAVEDAAVEDAGERKIAEFELNGRVMKSTMPNDSQLVFMMAAMGRGQSNDSRFASIVNIMLATLGDNDRDYVEGLMLESDDSKRLRPETFQEIFEYLVEQWFNTPTNGSSDSAPSEPSDGPNSTPTTTDSPEV